MKFPIPLEYSDLYMKKIFSIVLALFAIAGYGQIFTAQEIGEYTGDSTCNIWDRNTTLLMNDLNSKFIGDNFSNNWIYYSEFISMTTIERDSLGAITRNRCDMPLVYPVSIDFVWTESRFDKFIIVEIYEVISNKNRVDIKYILLLNHCGDLLKCDIIVQ